MTEDVRQWLTEIKSLQQKLATIQQERDEAYASAANWRRLYETEAKQRRSEASLAQQAIDTLKSELQRSWDLPEADQSDLVSALQQEVSGLQDVEELKQALVKALAECDRLARALSVEQAAHAQTRKALTTALGDAVDLLAKERAGRNSGQPPTVVNAAPPTTSTPNGVGARKPELRTPSLELPQFE